MRHKFDIVRDPSGRDWHHPSVCALAETERTNDPVEAITTKCRALTDHAREIGWDGPPYDVEVLASIAGLKVGRPIALQEDESAMLVDFTVLTNVEHALVRRRFSVCHEIVHTFFPDWRSAPQFTWRGDRDPDHEVETLCQAGASELIMPYWWFERDASAKSAASLETAVTIARRFCVSLEAAARRMVATTADAAALIVLSLGHRKSERQSMEMPLLPGLEGHVEQPSARLRIERTAAVSRRFRETGTYLPRNKSAPDQSICYASLLRVSEGEPACVSVADEDWPFGGLGACRIEAIGFRRGAGESPAVLALVKKLDTN